MMAVVLAAVAVAAAPGCQTGDDLPRHAVSGRVQLDGKPLESGAIQFLPVEGGSSGGVPVSGGTVIQDGAYEIGREKGLTPGTYRVSITSAAGGTSPPADEAPGPALPPAKDLIPAKYNVQSTLKAEVKANGPNTFDFDLNSK